MFKFIQKLLGKSDYLHEARRIVDNTFNVASPELKLCLRNFESIEEIVEASIEKGSIQLSDEDSRDWVKLATLLQLQSEAMVTLLAFVGIGDEDIANKSTLKKEYYNVDEGIELFALWAELLKVFIDMDFSYLRQSQNLDSKGEVV